MNAPVATLNKQRPFYPPTITPPPKPLGLPTFLVRFVRNPLETLPEPVYHEPILTVRRQFDLAWVADPNLIKTVLLDKRDVFPKDPLEKRVLGPLLGDGILIAEGRDWRWQRKIVAPLFRHEELLRHVSAFSQSADTMLDEWRNAPAGQLRALDSDMQRATFQIISDTLLPGGDDYVGHTIEQASADYLEPISWSIAFALLSFPLWFPYPGKRRMQRAERTLRDAIGQLVEARRTQADNHDDIFARLKRAENPETGLPMSDAQLVDNLLTFMLAGHETTARALTWTLYLISQSPEWEARMLEEINAVVPQGAISAEHIDKLPVVRQVLSESMRLYPPAPVLTRAVVQDTTLGGKDLQAGSVVIIPIYAVHRHRKLWQDPDKFDPSRFEPEKEKGYSRYQYMPFGAGPRICVGAAFAMLEAMTMLATFVRGATFTTKPGHVPTPVSRITLRPAGGMPMYVTMR